MITNFGDIRNQVIVRLGIATTSAYYTETILNDWVNSANKWATSYKKWPMTEGRVSTTFTSVEEWSFEGYKADSFRLLQVGGKRFQKLNFEDYQIFRESEPNSSERVFTDYGKLVLINPNSGVSGTLTAWGQYSPGDIDVTDLNAKTVFSDGDEEGNEAIVEKVIAIANTREKKPQVSEFHHTKASQILEALWGRTNAEQFNYHTHRSRGGMWQRFNIIDGGLDGDQNRRDQFPY